MDCVFCDIIAGRSPAEIVWDWDDAIAIKPLNPVTRLHTLVISRRHLLDAADEPDLTGTVAGHAAEYARLMGLPFNLITSAGDEATQTVTHLHWHIVPRSAGDGLHLPWTGQQVAT